ncbi:hypothetical protein ES705_35357 [subsurface metagenome]
MPSSVKSFFKTPPNFTGAVVLRFFMISVALIHSSLRIGFDVCTGTNFNSPPFTITVEVKVLLGSNISEIAYFFPLEHSAPTIFGFFPDLVGPSTFNLQDFGQIIHVIPVLKTLPPD